jgi:hypothetical protein
MQKTANPREETKKAVFKLFEVAACKDLRSLKDEVYAKTIFSHLLEINKTLKSLDAPTSSFPDLANPVPFRRPNH